MKSVTYWLLAFTLGQLPWGALSDEESQVVLLTSENFDALVGGGNSTSWFVKFYAPWCGHCKAMAPAWEELARKLDGSVKVGNVDCTKNRWLANQWNVPGYPTLLLIADSLVYEYKGKRDVNSMETWVLAGWNKTKGKPMPSERPWHVRMLAKASHYWPILLVMTLFCTVMCFYVACCGDSATEEEIARRKDFEARMKNYEARLSATKAKKAKAREQESTDAVDHDHDDDDDPDLVQAAEVQEEVVEEPPIEPGNKKID